MKSPRLALFPEITPSGSGSFRLVKYNHACLPIIAACLCWSIVSNVFSSESGEKDWKWKWFLHRQIIYQTFSGFSILISGCSSIQHRGAFDPHPTTERKTRYGMLTIILNLSQPFQKRPTYRPYPALGGNQGGLRTNHFGQYGVSAGMNCPFCKILYGKLLRSFESMHHIPAASEH